MKEELEYRNEVFMTEKEINEMNNLFKSDDGLPMFQNEAVHERIKFEALFKVLSDYGFDRKNSTTYVRFGENDYNLVFSKDIASEFTIEDELDFELTGLEKSILKTGFKTHEYNILQGTLKPQMKYATFLQGLLESQNICKVDYKCKYYQSAKDTMERAIRILNSEAYTQKEAIHKAILVLEGELI